MIRIKQFGVLLAIVAVLAACKPKAPEPELGSVPVPEHAPAERTPDQTPAADTPRMDAAAPASALLTACKVTMTQPEPHEWTTYWDPARVRTAGKNPSGARSFHWADDAEKKAANDGNTAIPLDLVCGNDQGAELMIAFSITAFDSSATDVPLAPGSYPIAAKASPGKNKPGEFIVGVLHFDKSMFQAKSGTLKIDRFDMTGIAGSFSIDGNEIVMGSRPLHLEGTFELPCRKAMLQSACQSDKAE